MKRSVRIRPTCAGEVGCRRGPRAEREGLAVECLER
jgi:hypothetical protein